MKPLDIVKTPKGNFAMITETNDKGTIASVYFFGEQNPDGEKNAWWRLEDGLTVVDNFAHVLAVELSHPFGIGKYDAEHFFSVKK